ncbi:hypothetical protein KF728_24595 [Candidatus Obscuribacterales bacterium]|nr:hypothetical protein [Candidatus Obscuribacterales bacterium]
MSKQQQNNTYSVSQFTRFTRVMALFTASLFLVSSNLALPAQAAALDQAVRADMTRQEWRQFRQENRAAGMPGRGLPNPVFTTQPIQVPSADTTVNIIAAPISTTNPGTVLINSGMSTSSGPNVDLGSTINANASINTSSSGSVILGSQTNGIGNVKTIGGGLSAAERASRREARADRRADRIQQREDRRATQGVATPQPVSVTRIRESREDRTARIQEHKNDKLSRFVLQENAGALIKLDNGANLDLTSATANITIGDKLIADGSFVTIEVGGEKKNIYAGSTVSAAEYVAVKQVLGGKQEIVVNGSGVATGGTVDLNNLAATRNNMKASGLTVASGVTAVGDLARDSSFRINGDLNNFGSVYAVATEKGRHSGDISAVNITNNEGALISSAAGNKLGNKADAIDLSLNADKNFSNFGTITSSGDLNVTAGGAIKNTGNATAKDNLSLNSADITNSGTVASTKGNITVDSPVGTVMNVNNAGGKLQALNGSINVRAPGNVDGLDSNITGGDLLSKTLELNAGQGMVDVNVNALTGTVNGSGVGAHVAASTDNLNIGDVCLTGDPTIKNAAGNINFTGNFTAGEALAVLASGNITATAAANITVTARAGNVGQPVVFAAGYGLTGVSTDSTTIPGATNAVNPITASSAVATGGSINLSSAASFNITTTGTALGASGGNVSLFANRQGGVGGDILLPTNSTINTSSGTTLGAANSGNVTIIGAGNIAVGSITADTNNSGNGNILIRNVNPTGSTTFATNGTISSGGFNTAGPATTGTITINNGATISGRNDITIDSASSITGAGTGAHNITSATGSVSLTGTSLTSSGGSFNIAANGGNTTLTIGAGNNITTGGGAFSASASGNVNITAASVNTTGAGAGGAVRIEADSDDSGNGNLNASGVAINTTGTAGGAGGTIDLDSGDNAGQVLQIGNLQSQGNGAGAGGNITFGALSGDAGNMTVGSMNAGTGTINIDANNANHTLALGGNIDTSSLTIDVGNGGSITSGGITITTNGYTVNTGSFNAGANTLTITTQTAGTTIGLNGGAGTLNIDGGELTDIAAGTLVIGTQATSGTITTGGSLTLPYNLTLASNGNIAGGGNFVLGGNNLIATANGSMTLGNITGGTGGAQIDLQANGGGLTVGNLANQSGIIDLDATGAVQTGTVTKTDTGAFTADGTSVNVTGAISTGSANTIINASTGNAQTVAVTTTSGQIDINSGSGSVTTGALQTASGAIDLDAATGITVASINVTGTGTVNLNGASVGITGNITGSAAGVTLTANNGNVTSGSISADGTTGAVDIDATNGLISTGAITGASLDADATNLIATGSITVTGVSGFVTLTSGTSSVATAGGITATDLVDIDAATTVTVGVVSGDITTAGAVDLTGNTGVTTRNIGGPASSITINSTSGAISTGTLTATGLIDVGGNTTTGVTTGAITTTGNVDLDASNTSAIQTGAIGAGAGNINVDSGSNNLGVLTNTGTIAVNAATTSTIAGINNAAGTPGVENVGITSGTTTNITGAINGGTGDIRLQGTTGDVNFTSANLTTGNLIIIAGNNTTGNSINTTTGNITITSTAGNTNITGAVAQAGGMMNITSGGTTNVGSYTNTTGDVIINSANTVTIGSTILTGAGSDIIIHSGANIITTGTLQADPIQMTAVGFISLGGSLIADNGISLVAGQDIFNTAAMSINANGATNGGNVTLVSGADFSVAGTNVTINGASSSGGSILFTSAPGFGNITATGGTGNGGNVTLVGYSNGFGGGQILLPTTSGIITTAGTAVADSGDVSVVSGAISGLGVQIGSITMNTATNGSPNTSTLQIQAGNPNTGLTVGLNAGYVGNFATGILSAADIRTGNITNRANIVDIRGAGNVGLGTVNVSGRGTEDGGAIIIEAQGSDVFDIGIAGGSNFAIGLLADGGTTSGDGGIIRVTNLGSTGIRTQGGLNISTTDGDGGEISLNGDQGNVSLGTGLYSVNGGGANGDGGAINLSGAGVVVTGGGAAQLRLNGAGTGNGGQLNIDGTGTPGLTLGNGAGQVSVQVNGTTNGLVDIEVGGPLTVSTTGGFTADQVSLTTTNAGSDITVNATVTGDAAIVVSASGNLIGSGTLVSPLMALASTGGNIGTNSASRLNINATDLIATAASGSVFLNDTAGGVNLIAPIGPFGPSGAANTFDLQANGAISNAVGGTVTATDVAIRSTGSTVTLNDVVTGSNSATIRGNGAITTAGAGQVNGGTVNLTSDTASVGTSSASRFQVDATNLVVNATAGSAFVRDANTVNIGPGASVVGATYDLTAVGDIQSSGSVTAQDVLLNAGASFFLNSTIVGNNSIALRSANSITNTNLGGATLTTPTLALRSVNGNIGSSSLSRLNIDANNLTAVAANGSVWIADANDVNLVSASGSNGDFDVVAGGNLSTDAASTIQSFGGSVLLRATTGSINTAGAITANTAGQSVTLRAGQSLLNGQVGGTFTTPTLNLISDNGNIGASTASRFNIGLGVANVTANAAAGSVFLTTASTVNLGAGTSSALNTFDVLTTGAADLTTSGAISAATVNLTAANNLTTNAAVTATGNATLTAGNSIATNAAVSGNNVSYVATTGGVTLGGATTGTTSISITSNNSIVNGSITGGLTAPQITLVTNNSVGVNAGTRLDLNATNLTVQAAVSAFINDTAGGVNLSGTNTAGTAFNLQANGDITNSGTITTGTGNIAFTATGAGSDIIVGNLISSGNNLNFQATGTGGTIAVNANVTAAAQITMSADSNLTTGVGASVVNNGLIVLNSNNGNIGTSAASRFLIDANNVQATAPNGSVWIEDTDAVNVANGASVAGQTFDLVANGNLNVNGGASVTGNNVVLRAAGAGSVLGLSGNVTGTTSATLRADGNIVNASGVANVTTPQLNLISDNGSIGIGPANRLNINATNLTANAATDVFINDTAGGVNIGAASSAATGAFNVIATGGALTTTGTISGNNVALTGDTGVTIGAAINAANNATLTSNANNVVINGVVTAGNNVNATAANAVNVNAALNGTNVNLVANGAAVNVNAAVTGSNSITVDSVNSITNGTLGGNLNAPTITLISDNSIGGAGNRLNITANNLSLTAGNNAFVDATGSVNLLASSAVNTLDVAAANNLTTSGAVTADNVVLRATAGSLTLGALVNGTTSVSLRSFNSLTNLNAPAAFVTTGAGGTVNLTSDNGDIGVGPTSRFVIDADNLTANAANGSVYILDTDSVNLGAGSSSAANNFDVVAAQDITNSGTVSANNVSLRATAGTLTLGALVTGVTSVSLRSGGSITDGAVVNVVSDQINLTSDNGDIGTLANPLNIDALNLTANAFAGNVFVNDANTVTIGAGSSSALNTFSVTAGLNLFTTGTILGQDVALTATNGSLFIGAQITGGTSISLTQSLTMTNANISAPLVSPQINLTSTAGSIGTGTFNRLTLDAASISFNAAGSVFFQDPNTVNVSGATAGGTIDILANNDLSTSGLVTGNAIVLTSTVGDVNLGGATVSTTTVNVNAGDDINVNSPVFGTVLAFNATGDINFNANVVGTTSLTAVAGDNIDFNSAGGAPVVNFTATNGNVTVDANLIATTSLTINAGNQIDWNAGGGSQVVTFNTTNGDVNINALLAGTTSVTVNAGDDINTTANTVSPVVAFTAVDDINLNGNINASTSATLVAGGTITQGGGNIITGGGALSLTFTEGPVTLNTNVFSLTTNAAGQTLTINENNAINLLSQNLDTLTVNAGLVGGGPINVQVALNLTELTLNNNNGNINLNASTTTTGDTSLSATGTINQNAGVVTADQLNLLWGTGNVTLATEVNSLSANGGTNSLTINEATSIDIVNLLVGAATINASGNISTSASFPNVISALTGNLALNANGDIILGSDVSAFATAFLNAGGTITQNAGIVSANTLDLTWVTGAVELDTAANNLNANAAGQDLTINNAGGINILNINLNALTVNAGLTTTGDIVVVNPLTVPGPLVLNNADGDIVLNAGITSLSAELTASGTLTQTAGVIETGSLILTWGTGNVTLNTSVDFLVATSAGNNLTINQTGDIVLGAIVLDTLSVTAASDIETSVDFTVANLNLTATGGSINLNSNVNVTNIANLIADNTITQGATNLFGGEGTLNLTWQTGDVSLNTQVGTLTATGAVGSTLNILENTGINLGSIVNLDELNVTAGINATGDLNVTVALVVPTLNLTTDGNIGINAGITSTTSASITATGDITQTAGSLVTPNLTIGGIIATGGTVSITDTNNGGNDQSITVVGLSNSTILTTETGVVTLQGSTGSSIDIDASASSQFVFGGNSFVANTLSVTASNVLNENTQTATTIDISSASGDLTVSGGAGGTWVAFAGGTNFTAIENLNLDGIQDITGNATFTSGVGFAINVLATADVEATGSITLNTCNLNLAGILIGNPIYFNCPLGAGTIANSNGDVLLTSDLIFTGLDLAIIASGSIIENGITVIDLSNAGGDGGSLTLLAGFDFTPATLGQVGPDSVLYTITGNSGTGGSIQLGTTNITTASTGILGDGGNVFAAASGGSVELNNVDTSAALGAGGNVTVTGETGITVNGNISSVAVGSGNVSLAVGTSVVNGQVLIGNGEMFGSGSIDFGTATAGNILVSGNLNAGDASATLRGALNAVDTITVNGTLTADTLNVNAGDGNTTVVSSNVLNLNSTSTGTVELQSNTGDLAIGAVSGANQNLIVNNDGTIDVNSAMSIGSLNLTQNNIGAEGISINAPVTTVTDITLTNEGTNAITVGGALNAGGNITIAQNGLGGADVLINASLTTTGGNIDIDSADVISTLAGTSINSAGTLDLFAVGSILIGGAGAVSSGSDMSIVSLAGDVVFGTNTVTSGGTTDISGGNVTTGGDVISTGVMNITATTGEVVLNDALSGLSDINVLAATNVVFNPGINAIGTLGNVSVEATTGSISLNGVDTQIDGGNVILTAGTDISATGAQSLSVNALNNLTINAPIDLTGGLVLTGESVTANGNISADAGISIGVKSNPFTTNGDITSLGDIYITTNVLENTNAITGANVYIQSFAGSGVTVDGSAGPGGLITATGVIEVTGTGGDATFLGEQTFDAPDTAFTSATNFAVVIGLGADVTVTGTLDLNTCNLVLLGSLTAPIINFNCPLGAGTIANSIGNVDLTGVGALNFSGLDLAILAQGNVLAGTNTSINLSSSTGDGGDLLVVAGFDFTPATGGQVNFSPTLFTITGTSTSGGNIDFTGLTINTGSTFAGGNGGSVTLVANGGLTNAGTITTEAITTTGDNNGGAVTIIGEGDIHLNGTVNTTGTNGTGGDVTLAVAQAFLAPGPSTQVGNGELLQGGFAVGAASLGELLAGTINAGNGNVAITSSSGGFDTTSIADLTANSVSFTVGDGSAIVDTSAISNLNVTSYGSGSGYVELTDNHASITLTSNAGSNDVSVSITNNANIAVGAGAHTYGLLDLNGSLVTVNGDIDASSNVTANGAAGVAVNGSIISDATVSLAATIMGNVVISGPVTGASVNLATNSSFGNIFIDGVVTANAIGGAITITTNGGGVSQTANVDADILNLNLTNGGTVNLSNALNSVDALNVNAAGAASVTFVDSVALTLTATSNAAQDLNVSTTGTLDLASAIVANDVVLSGATLDVDNTVNATNATLTATAGDLTITSSVTATGNATLTSDAGDVIVNAAVSGDVTDISTGIGSGGLIFLSADVTGTTSVDLVSDGGLTQVAGTIFGGDLGVAFNTGAATLTTDVASLDSIVNGTSLTVNEANAITLGANLGTDLTVNTTNGSIDTTVPLSFANLNLNAGGVGSDLNLGADVTGSTTIVLTANDAIVPAIGTVINGGALTLNFGNLGPTVLGTNVASLTTNNAGGDLTIINTGDIVLNGQDVASLSVTTVNGDITTAAALTGLNTLTLTAGGSNDINLNGGAVSATTLNLTAAGGNVTQNATSSITATTLNLDVDATADLDAVANAIGTLNASGAGDVFLDNGATALNVGSVGPAQSLYLTAYTGGVTIGANLTTTGDIVLNTNQLTNTGFAVNANLVTVTSDATSGLIVNGGSGVNVAQYGATNGVFFNATLDNLVLNGNTTFTSIAELSALNGTDMIVISTGANVIGQQQLTVNTCNLILQGILVCNPLVWNNPCGNGTIANSTGDVNLLGDIIYNGQDLAILASGSINAAGATVINLTNSSGNGGNLTLMAGYDFTPATPGQVTNGNVEYTISGYSTSGGNINLGGLDVITNGSAGSNGGNVIAVANGGSGAAGNITIGDITSNGDNGGNLQVIAEGAIDLGAVNLNGTIAGGNATISTATPSNGAGITVFNGIVTGTFTAGANLGGSVTFDSIDTNNGGDVTLVANLNTGTAGTVTGDVVTLTSSSDIGVDAANRFTVNANTVTGTAVGDAFIRNTNTAASTLGAITVATGGTIDAYFTGDLATGAKTAGVIELRTDGAFNVTGVLNGSTSIGLTSGTDLTNTQVAAANLVTPLLTLRTSNNADIGSTGTAFQVGAGTGEIRIDTATNGGDSAYVTSLATGGVNLGASTATNDLFFSANGPLTVIGNVTNVDGNINITGGSGTLRINNGVTVQANSPGSNGNVFIGNAINGGSKQGTFITFGDGAQIIGNAAVKPGGNVTIQMGELTSRVRNLTNPPRNVTYNAINGGVIQGGKSAKPFYAGRNGDPANTITADNATVFISNTLKNKNIILEGNVLIQADPPSVAGEAATTNAYLPNGGSFETVANKANDGLTTNTASSTEATFANTMLNTMFNSNAGVMANTAIGTDLNATATAAGVGNGAGSTVTAADTTLVGGVATTGEDNSYMVGGYGPTAQADASICSDVELGVSGNEVAKTAHSNRVVLKKGNVLFVPFQDTVVETPHGNVTIEAKSVALVSISNDKLAVYDIEDSHKGSVSVNAHGQTITLAPGNHVTVAHATSGEFAQVNAIEAIPHRNVATKTIKAGVKAHTSEFSVASAISSIKPLQLVMCSKHPQAKQVANKMMKTTAILLHMGGKGEFQHYFKPAMTAMAK